MYLRKLTLTNMRAFRNAEFDFLGQPGVHLIVGVNGVGKSTALEALRISLAQAVRKIEKTVVYNPDFPPTDITINQEEMEVEVTFEAGNVNFVYTRKRFSAAFLATPGKTADDPDFLYQTKSIAELKPDFNTVKRVYDGSILPLVIFFSPLRSVIERPSRQQLEKLGKKRWQRQNPAYDDALASRPSKLIDFYQWLKVLEELAKESDRYELQRQEMEKAISRFIPKCTNLRTTPNAIALLIDKDGDTFDILQLSDGEKGVLALVLEISRRLAQANPDMIQPNEEASAVILIDELDLHLHPGWQRDIVRKLQITFPNCQFICSTHSPQIVGEVPHERVSLAYPTPPQVEKPSQSFGMEANWILQTLFETLDQNKEVDVLEKDIFLAIQTNQLELAQKLLDELRILINGSSEKEAEATAWISRLNRLKSINEVHK